MSTKKHLSLAQLDELDTLIRLLSVIGDLMNPEPDMSTINRDNLAMMLNYLSGRMQAVMEGMGVTYER